MTYNAHCQLNVTDSIMDILSLYNDTEQLEILKQYALGEQYRSLRAGLEYADKRMEIARKNNDPEKIAETYHIYGNLYTTSGLLGEAEKNYLRALRLFDSLKIDEERASILHNLGLVAFKNSDTLGSINYYKRSIDLRKEVLDNRRIGDELTTLGEAYLSYKNYEGSRQILIEALQYYSDTSGYERKFDAYAFLFDNLQAGGQTDTRQWIDSMINENRKIELPLFDNMIRIRLARYHLSRGEPEECASQVDSIDFSLLHEHEVIDPVTVIADLAEYYRLRGDHPRALRYRLLYREKSSEIAKSEVEKLVSNYNIRLNIRASEENITWAREQNELIKKRLELEKVISLTIYLALGITILVLAYMWYSLIVVRRTNTKLEQRKASLQEAYDRSTRYKEKILSIRENKSDFFSIISLKLSKPFHGLTSRLNEISEYLEKHNKDLRLKTNMDKLYKDAAGIEKGLEKILMWSKLQRNKYAIEHNTFNLSDYLHEVLPSLLRIALRKDIRIRFDIDPLIEITYDKFSLKTILTLLTENSVEYSSPRSDIIIRAIKSKSGCILSVTDFGTGIDEKLMSKIFDLSRVKNENMAGGDHKMGLGLLIAKLMTENNNSTISVESKKNKGTTIFIHINNTHE